MTFDDGLADAQNGGSAKLLGGREIERTPRCL